MDDALFNQPVESIREAGKIIRGEQSASRIFEYTPLDIKSIREKTGLSQDRFANVMGISLRAYQNREQGHRHPTGPALALLSIFQRDPENALKALHA